MTESLEQKIIKTYVPGESSLRKLAKELGTNHKSQEEWDYIKTNIGLYLI